MVEIKDMSLAYNQDAPVISKLSLDVAPGECILIAGTSGSGKSSIINAINGLATRYDGAAVTRSVAYNNKDISQMQIFEIAQLISTVFQNPKTYFFNVNTTLELLFYLENLGLSREEMDKRMHKMLSLFPIEHLLDRDIFQLSGGEKQILCVASCYMAGTQTILLDEPSSNLDGAYIDLLGEVLKLLKAEGITLILAEHRLYYAMDIVDRIVYVDSGAITQSFTKAEFMDLSEDERKALGLRAAKKPTLCLDLDTQEGDLCVQKLTRPFKTQKSCLEIDELSFSLGKIYGIVGNNGCGKSTFVRSLIGVEKESKEIVSFKGKPLSKKERIKLSSLVMQDVNHQLFSDEVSSEVALGTKQVDTDKVLNLLEHLNLSEYKERHPLSLSGGQKQRLAIASVLYDESTFIFFDEPTSGMDFANMVQISKLIKEASHENNIIFIISHDVEFLNMTADYVVDMSVYRH